MRTFQYGFETTLSGVSYDEAVQRVTEELKKEGFGVLTEIDVKATLKKKLDVDFRRYAILGACNPPLAKRALEADGQIGLLLPCNVVVQETDEGKVSVSVIDPKAMFTLVDDADVAPIAEDVEQRVKRVIGALEAGA